MKLADTLATLRKLGKPSAAATYERHGLGTDVYGVSFADLGKLSKKIGRDHDLALALWKTGNVDARFLATMVADPELLDAKTVDRWLATVEGPSMVMLVADLVAKTSFAVANVDRWRAARGEVVKAFGYSLVASLLKAGVAVPDAKLARVLRDVVRDIHGSPNRARYAMNGAVIAIGAWRLHDEAVAAARRIGKVEVDHGDTACKTPDAESYIEKARARARKSAAGEKTARKPARPAAARRR